MASESKPRLPSIQTMFLSLLGCTARVSPIEDMCYMTTSKRLTLTSPAPLQFDDRDRVLPPLPPESPLERSRSSIRKKNRKQSVIIGSPSGFQHEFHVSSDSELHELETLRQEVERRVQEAAMRHAEMNALARRRELEREESITSTKMASRSASGVKRKPVPSLYPYSSPSGWSTATLPPLPPTARSSRIIYPDPIPSVLASDSASEDRHSSEASDTSLGDIHDIPSLGSDDNESSSVKSSVKSSCAPCTPISSSPHLPPETQIAPEAELVADSSEFMDDLPIELPIGKSVESILSPQPTIAVIDSDCLLEPAVSDDTLTIEAGQVAKDARVDMQDHIRSLAMVDESEEVLAS